MQTWSNIPRHFIESFGEEGDFARQYLLNPTLFLLLGDVKNRQVLDAGCGTGYLARLLNRQGAQVVGIEPATPLFDYAVEREQREPLGIKYIQADLTAWHDPAYCFDVVIANMVLMDIPDYQAALNTCFSHLRPNGQFICSLTHPCFEESDSDYQAKGYIVVREYFQEYSIDQRWGRRFHRPLSDYFKALLQRGSIQAVVEPQLTIEQARCAPEGSRNLHVPSFIIIQASKHS
jgi:SAM-dependent methyltransferase